MKFILVAALLFAQFGPRVPLTPAETLLEPAMLEAIRAEASDGPALATSEPTRVIEGTDSTSGEIILSSDGSPAALHAIQILRQLIDARALPRPARTIRFVAMGAALPQNAKTAILLRGGGSTFAILRSLWSTANIADEVVEIFARNFVGLTDTAGQNAPQTRWGSSGIPMTAILYPRE